MEEKDPKVVDDRKINYTGMKAMPFVIGNETFEKLGTNGTLANFLVYLTTVFNMKSITATTLVYIFNGTTNFATLIGAFLSDSFFGRYKTIAFASVASFLGMLLITLTAAVPKLHPSNCGAQNIGSSSICPGPTPGQLTVLAGGLGLLVIGGGGIRPNNLAFGADQFDPDTESGKRGISSFINWYFFTLTFAMMTSLTGIVYVQSDVSWAWGFAIPAIMMFLSCVLFFMGSNSYVKVQPSGHSPFTSAIQVIAAAINKRKLKLPDQPWLSLFNHFPPNSINSKLPYTNQFRFLDRAAIVNPDEDKINPNGSAANPWRLCSMQQVEEVKCLARVFPVWISGLVYYIATNQQQTYIVFQALQSDRRFWGTDFQVPAASYVVFSLLGLTIWIPIYDRILVPWLEKLNQKKGGITILKRMGVGMVVAIISTIISGIVEEKRRASGLKNPIGIDSKGRAISAISAFWLVPQLTLMGISEAFTAVAQAEFNYKQFPENMRSISGSLVPVGIAIANYLSSLLISAVHYTTKSCGSGRDWLPEDLNMGRLDYYYYLIAALCVLNLIYFVPCAKWYKYKGDYAPNGLQAGMEKLIVDDSRV